MEPRRTPNLRNTKLAPADCAHFSDFQLPKRAEFYERLRALPCIKTHRFLRYINYLEKSEPRSETVDVRKIIGFQHGTQNGWVLRDHGRDYLWNLAKAIRDRKFNPELADGLTLLQMDDIYFIDWNGRHRAAALKGMIHQSPFVPARVSKVKQIAIAGDVEKRMRFKDHQLLLPFLHRAPNDFRELFEREKQGLWKGQLLEVVVSPCSSWRSKLFGAPVRQAQWRILEAKAPYVFAEDIDEAMKVYNGVR